MTVDTGRGHVDVTDTFERYDAAVLSHLGKEHRRSFGDRAQAAMAMDSLYGSFVDTDGQLQEGVAARYLRLTAEAFETGDMPPLLANHLTPQLAAMGLDVVVQNMNGTTTRFYEARPQLRDDDAFEEALQVTRTDIVRGQIRGTDSFLPDGYAMTKGQGSRQVSYADAGFSVFPSHVQLMVADINYRDWDGSIMTTGNEMLAGDDNLSDVIDQSMGQGMAHLRASNMAIGDCVRDIAASAGDLPVTVLNLGAGSGATTAMNVMGLAQARESYKGNLRYVDVEGTKAFYDSLKGPFSDDVANRLKRSGYELQDLYDANALDAATLGDTSSVGFVYDDLSTAVSGFSLTEEQAEGLLVVTANYCLHRLPQSVKKEMFERLGAMAKNVVVLVGDLAANESRINRAYFNFGSNGPANCGNMRLKEVFNAAGLRTAHLDKNFHPVGMNAALVENMSAGPQDDAHFYVASKGDMAKAALDQWGFTW